MQEKYEIQRQHLEDKHRIDRETVQRLADAAKLEESRWRRKENAVSNMIIGSALLKQSNEASPSKGLERMYNLQSNDDLVNEKPRTLLETEKQNLMLTDKSTRTVKAKKRKKCKESSDDDNNSSASSNSSEDSDDDSDDNEAEMQFKFMQWQKAERKKKKAKEQKRKERKKQKRLQQQQTDAPGTSSQELD